MNQVNEVICPPLIFIGGYKVVEKEKFSFIVGFNMFIGWDR